MTLRDELPMLVGAQYATGEEWRNGSRKNEVVTQSENSQLLMWLVMEEKSDAILHRNLECQVRESR